LERVRNCSSGEIGMGYWILNIFGVSHSGNIFTPLLSQLYSFTKNMVSENSEILMGIDCVLETIHKALIWVIDRGGDRDQTIQPLIWMKQYFIIRLRENRHLSYKGKAMSIRQISKKAHLIYSTYSQESAEV